MDDDPIASLNERLKGYMTLALTVAARVAEVYAYRRQQQRVEAAKQSEAMARQVEAQHRAEAAAARYQLRDATRSDWWDKATPEQGAAAYATARAHAPFDTELAGMARYMGDEIERRYGINPDELVGREEQRAAELRAQAEQERAVAEHTAAQTAAEARAAEELEAELVRYDDVLDKLPPEMRAEFERAGQATEAATGGLQGTIEEWAAGIPAVDELMHGRQQREQTARAAGAETAEATALLAEANGIDGRVLADGIIDSHEAWHDEPVAVADWDAAARHEALGARLTGAMPDAPDAVSARMTVDAAQGKPAVAATGAKPAAKAPRARTAPVKGAERSVGR